MKQRITVTYCDICNRDQKRNRGHRGYFISDSDIHKELLERTKWGRIHSTEKGGTILNVLDACPECLKERP